MEINPEIVEGACELAEEALRRKLAAGREAVTESSQKSAGWSGEGLLDRKAGALETSGGRMDGFNEKDAANLQAATEAVGAKAAEGDVAAAAAFEALLDAQTRRAALVVNNAALVEQGASPAASWQDTVSTGRQAGGEPARAA